MSSILAAVLAAAFLFVGVLLCIELGYRIGRKKRLQDPEAITRGIGGMEAAIFGLLGLLTAFIFGGAASRFDNRRQLIISETNAIGTAALRMDLLPETDRPVIKKLLRDYVDARIVCQKSLREGRDETAEVQRAAQLQQQLWSAAVAALQRQGSAPATQLLLPAMNEMFDIGSSRVAATRIHAPSVIVILLFAMVLLGSTLAGYGMSARLERARLHTIVFAAAMTVTVYVTLDLELPRVGLIRLDSMDQLLVDVRKGM